MYFSKRSFKYLRDAFDSLFKRNKPDITEVLVTMPFDQDISFN